MREPIKILYEDDSFVVFDKPPGLLVIPSPKKEKNTLVSIVNAQYDYKRQDIQRPEGRLHPCHRLDRDTSGAILFARGKKNQQRMMKEFQSQAVGKKYIAFVRGEIKKKSGEMRSAVRPVGRGTKRAKPAVTRYNVKSIRNDFSVVEVFPQTGRTNQIRIHFSKIGHPLLGERVYAFGKDFPVKFRRLALHANELIWQHPVLKKRIKVTSLLPKDMAGFLKKEEVPIGKRRN